MYNFDEEVNRKNTNSLKWDIKEGELPMWVADMDFKTCPAVTKSLIKRAKHGVFGYTIVPDKWYKAIINWWKKRHEFTIKKQWLQFTTGVIPAISSIVKRVTNIGDNIVVLTPVYDIFFHSIENFGRHTLESKLIYKNYRYEIDFEDLEKKLSLETTTMLIFCNPHNPIGKIWTKEEMAKIGELCAKYGVVILSDEIHGDLTAIDFTYTPFASVSKRCLENSITCVSASKAFNLAGLQSAAVFVQNEVLRNKVFRGLNSDEVAEPNCFAIEAIVAAFTKGEQWLDELRVYISENKRIVKNYLEDNLPELALIESNATYLLWIDISKLTNDAADFCKFIRQNTGLYLSCGEQYRGNGKLFIRMNIACSRSKVLDGLKRLETGIKLFKQ